MADWRNRCAVPDSEDEEESQSPESDQNKANDHDDDAHKFQEVEESAEKEEKQQNFAVVIPVVRKKRVENGDSLSPPRGAGKNTGIEVIDATGHHFRNDYEDDIDELQMDHMVERQRFEATNQPRNQSPVQEVVLVGNGVEENDNVQSNTSSPLSSVHLSDAEMPEALDPVRVSSLSYGTQRPNSTSFQAIRLEESPGPGAPAERESDAHVIAHVAPRLLRPRNPEQLFPYAIESERYKRTLKGRGLQPLRIAHRETQEDDSDASAPEEQDSYTSPNRNRQIPKRISLEIPSSPPQTPMQNRGSPRGSQEIRANLEEEEFPDLSTMLRRPLPQVARNGFKRAKIAHTYSNQDRYLRRNPASNPQCTSPRHRTSASRGQMPNIFDIPPSPPTSGLRSSSLDAVMPPKNHFRVPAGLPEPQTQAPLAYSASRYPQTPFEQTESVTGIHSSDSEPVRHSDRRHRRVIVIDDLDSHRSQNGNSEHESQGPGTSESSSEEEEEQLHKVQRRIRGVLPASWLRLDMKAGTAKEQNLMAQMESEPLESPKHDPNHRGIARPVSRLHGGKQPTAKESPIIISDESSIERENAMEDRQRPLQGMPGNVSLAADVLDWPDSESMEDDRIDHMLQPATKRVATRRKKPKVRQTLLSYGIDSPRVNKMSKVRRNKTSGDHGNGVSLGNARTKSGIERKRSMRVPKPRLGILDITQASTQNKLPTFINLAARSARSRRDLGRQSPSKKVFRLATREDTADIQMTLASWRNGSLAQRSRGTAPLPSTRVPLSATSGNKRFSSRRQSSYRQPDAAQNNIGKPIFEAEPPSRKGQSKVEHVVQSILARQRSQRTGNLHVKAVVPKPLQTLLTRRPRQIHISSSVHARGFARPALLETVATDGSYAPVGPRSYKTPRPLMTIAANSKPNPILDRFLQEQVSSSFQRPIEGGRAPQQFDHAVPAGSTPSKPEAMQRRRKLAPKQLDVKSPRFHTAIEIEDEDPSVAEAVSIAVDESSIKTSLFGLGPHGTEYSLDFDIEPEFPGSYFWTPMTGENLKSMKALGRLKRRNLDEAVDEVKYVCFAKEREWGAWTESLHADLSEIFKQISDDIQSQLPRVNLDFTPCRSSQALNALDSISTFISQSLYFLDPIDRASFIKHILAVITLLSEGLYEQGYGPLHGYTELVDQSRKTLRSMNIRVLNILTQIHFISIHELVPIDSQKLARAKVEQAFRHCVDCILSPNLKETWLAIRRGQDLNMYSHEDDGQAECLIETLHLAGVLQLESVFDERLLLVNLDPHKTHLRDARTLENAWRDVFTLLPFLQRISNSEKLHMRWLKSNLQQWALVKQLVEPVLESYRSDTRGQAPSFNAYLRTIIGRCLKLVQQWKWQKPEVIIGIFFDFFARNGLGNLEHEHFSGSPSFLQQLREDTTLDYSPRDSGFRLYLKLLGASLRSMRDVYPAKKIRDIAWRYMPNHGRNLPKDQSLRQEDLDALRNHHDLLCVLYWASPSDFRPRVTAIQNLVQIETSHREACHINIRTWSNLIKYQLSTDEDNAKLKPFANWISDLLSQILHLHTLARSEVETQAKVAELSGLGTISPEDQEMMISRNQRQVEAILQDALVSLKSAMASARTGPAARALFPGPLSHVLDVLDAQRPRTHGVVLEALEAYSAFAQKYVSEQGESESQNYGDWSAFEDESQGLDSTFLEEKMLCPIHQLLSNTLGMDNLPDDNFVTKVVNTWTDVVHLAVSQGTKTWDDILGSYGSHTWKSLRDTEQTRKYTPYAFAALIRKDKGIFKEHEGSIIKAWLASCLDRDSILKFQHLLTNAVLNQMGTNPLFNNLQSTIRRQHDRCTKSINEFRNSRNGLLSIVLATMRENLDYRAYHELGDGAKPKQDFVSLVKHIMTTMKANYQGLGSSNLKSAYVEFVHVVVGLLQQHTADICPIDRFFVDSADFPAPVTDPAYVVDRILNYVRRFKDGKSSKQLASLIQNLCERAVIENNTEALADQLETALHMNGRDDHVTKEALLGFMLDTIMPVYVDVALNTCCGWLLAEPLLKAMRGTFQSLVSRVKVANNDSHDKTCLDINHYLETVRQNMVHWLDERRDFHGGRPLPSRAFGLILETVTALLPLLDCLYQCRPESNLARDARNQFIMIKLVLRHYKRDYCAEYPDRSEPSPLPEIERTRPQYDAVGAFALRELKSALGGRWQERQHENGDAYARLSSRGEWVKVADGYSRDTDAFPDEFRMFNKVHLGLEGLHEDDDWDDKDFREAKEAGQAWDWRDETRLF